MRLTPVLFRLAWRNLWRNHRRTIIMLGAVGVGVWAMIFMTALTRGMVDQMVIDSIGVLPGHVQMHHPDFQDDPSISNRIPFQEAELQERFAGAGFKAWASRVRVPAVISSERESRGVTLLGVDPDAERDISFFDYDAVDGRYLTDASDQGIVIGKKLAETLETGIGKRVVLMSQDPDNDIADRGFRVIGLYAATTKSVEESYAYIGKSTAQQMLNIGDETTEVVFLGDDYRDIEGTYKAVSSVVDASVSVLRWHEIDTYLGTMMRVMDGFVLIWVVVIFMALSFGLVNTLVMAVFERVREIGLMLALGMKPGSILGQILIESMLLLTLGLAAGNALAWATVVPLEDGIDISIVAEGMEMWGASSMLYPKLYASDMILATGVVLLLGFLASLAPAWRASRYKPVEAITKV
ncbi:MAG: FtsX-like permease family protein [Gammaproteobacteria bacterium]|nr:FtsX-like permease family protein [Gammaproteobacteria bacterium]MDH5239335.1 FtsX-like permease family protein [Gammaproteobacteria bacterium]MDH5260624.1 FtsX-like permease family protein [Gammaproteobacteria bacterium]MDH5583118.1 FtsX-like permease family protein [Gammaproteobacteria bacterium]